MNYRCTLAGLVATLVAIFLADVSLAIDEACRSNLERQMNERAKSVESFSLSDHSFSERLKAFTIIFAAASVDSTDYECSKSKPVEHPSATITGWLYEFSGKPSFEVIDTEERFFQIADSSSGYEINGAFINNLSSGTTLEVNSSIKFFLDNIELLQISLPEYELIVSGPFWKRLDYLDVPIGLVKARGRLVSGVVDFSAQNILCSGGDGIDLVSFEGVRQKQRTGRFSVVRGHLERFVEQECSNAIQTGPAYFEPAENGRGGLVGVSGQALNEGVRTAIIKGVSNVDGTERVFILTTAGPISSFDTMVLIAKVFVEAKTEQEQLVWAVGLQDDVYASGPVVISEGNVLPLNDIAIPTGAVLLFKPM